MLRERPRLGMSPKKETESICSSEESWDRIRSSQRQWLCDSKHSKYHQCWALPLDGFGLLLFFNPTTHLQYVLLEAILITSAEVQQHSHNSCWKLGSLLLWFPAQSRFIFRNRSFLLNLFIFSFSYGRDLFDAKSSLPLTAMWGEGRHSRPIRGMDCGLKCGKEKLNIMDGITIQYCYPSYTVKCELTEEEEHAVFFTEQTHQTCWLEESKGICLRNYFSIYYKRIF